MPGSGYRVGNMTDKVLAIMEFTFWLGELDVKIIIYDKIKIWSFQRVTIS